MIKKKIIALLLILSFIGLFAYQKINKPFLYSGTIEATKIDLSAQVSSTIAEIKFTEGDSIKKGDVLINLSCQDLILAADIAQKNFIRAEKLFRAGSLPQESFEQIKYRNDDASLKKSWCQITSPIDGKIISIYKDVSELVTPGQKLLSLADLTKTWANIYVPAHIIATIKLGQSVRGIIPELATKHFPGKIIKISDEAEFTPKNVQTRQERERLVFAVKIEFQNSEIILKPGMTVEVEL